MTFRFWCREKWFEYIDERGAYKQVADLNPTQYFQKYKYWLKREYQHQQRSSK